MADVLRLQVVYETQGAVASVQRLERSSKGASVAAVHLAQAMAEGNVSAVTLSRSLEHLGGPVIGGVAIGLGLVAAGFALWVHHTEKQEKLVADLNKELETTERRMNALLGIETTATGDEIQRITDRIKELQRELNKPNWFERLVTAAGKLGQLFVGLGNPLGLGQAPPQQAAIDRLARDRAILAEHERVSIRATQTQQAIAEGAKFDRPEFRQAAFGASGMDEKSARFEAESIRRQERIFDSWTAGLHVMQDSLEEFLVTGKFVFRQLIDELLRIAFHAASDQFVDKAIRGVIDLAAHNSGVRKTFTKTDR